MDAAMKKHKQTKAHKSLSRFTKAVFLIGDLHERHRVRAKTFGSSP
jgi:hypothetical protein